MLTSSAIIDRLHTLSPGDLVVYYEGNLAAGMAVVGSAETAAVAMRLYEKGRVHLLQRRLSPPMNHLGMIDWHGGHGKGFQYLAIGAYRNRTPSHGAHLRSVLEAI